MERQSYLSHSRLYRIYYGMLDRCCNEESIHFIRYGAKGITVCLEWVRDRELFIEWALNNGYMDNLTIDRINNERGYSPKNCRWVTVKDQNNNKSTNHYVEYMGKTKTLAEWCELFKLNYDKTRQRLKFKGWTATEAFSERKFKSCKTYEYQGRLINESERADILLNLKLQINSSFQFHEHIEQPKTKREKINDLKEQIDQYFVFYEPNEDKAA